MALPALRVRCVWTSVASVISITIFRLFAKLGGRDATILEHNIVQTAGSAGESIAFGIGVTMPAILILGFDLEIARVTIGKRLSDRIYLTYVRSLSSSERDQIILLEYDQSDTMGWVMSQNEDGTYALEVRKRVAF